MLLGASGGARGSEVGGQGAGARVLASARANRSRQAGDSLS